jgi:REP element-mobilizing transposase RayT
MDAEAYEEGSDFSITIATAGRSQLFADPAIARLGVAGLRAAVVKYDALVYAYCFMPDHVHLLAGVPGGVNAVRFIRHFKQLTAYAVRRLPGYTEQALWQRSFYDHALRREEDLETVANYILDNPVRAGLVSEAMRYPYAGSLTWEAAFLSGSEDPDLRAATLRFPPSRSPPVGEGLQTLAQSRT